MRLSDFARSILADVRAVANVGDPDGVLEFYSHALARGASEVEADAIDQYLTARVMAARGAI